MGTLRLSLVGTVVVVLSQVTAASVVAQSEDPARTVQVTGISSCTHVQEGTSSRVGIGRNQHRDAISECTTEMSDPRVSGTWRSILNEDCYLVEGTNYFACVMWGTEVLDDDEGGWECSWTGMSDLWGENEGRGFGVCSGTGGYAGLTFVGERVFGGAEDFGDGTNTHGVIFEGPPPGHSSPPAEQ